MCRILRIITLQLNSIFLTTHDILLVSIINSIEISVFVFTGLIDKARTGCHNSIGRQVFPVTLISLVGSTADSIVITDGIFGTTFRNDVRYLEIEWQTEEDVRIIERYQEIMNDKARKDRAVKKAMEKSDNLRERAIALDKSITGIKKK